jgi:hypothetical protein
MKSGGGNFSCCAMDVLRLGVSYSSVAAWAYVIIGGGTGCNSLVTYMIFIYKDARFREHKIV